MNHIAPSARPAQTSFLSRAVPSEPVRRGNWLESGGGQIIRKTALAVACLLLPLRLPGQDLNLSPARPTIANSASIQSPGVLQVELGYDGYPQRVPGKQQTVAANLFYVPLARLRLDFEWSPYVYQSSGDGNASGVGTIQVGGKIVLQKEDIRHPAPALAVQYEAELPTASQHSLQGFGQQISFLANHHYGRNGIFDLIVNGSLVQYGCQTQSRCTYGGQQSVAISYHLRDSSRVYAELFGQNNSQSNTPPGTYVFGGFYQKIRDSFGFDGGIRFGVTNHSASIGMTLGVVFGCKVRSDPPSRHKW